MANRNPLEVVNKPSRSISQPPIPNNINVSSHGSSQSTTATLDKFALSPSSIATNSFQRRSAIHTDYGKSPVSYMAGDNAIKFDYNVFVTTWQDQIKMRQYTNCEKYCREVIEKLLVAEDKQQVQFGFNSIHQTKSAPLKNDTNIASDDDNNTELHSLLEYRSKVHFSLAYLLKKYFKRYDEAREQYEESIKTDRENPGAHFNLANMLVDHYKDYETAQYHFEKSIALEPSYSLYRMTYAEFLWHDVSEYKESSKQYESLIQSDEEKNPDIYYNYGLLLRDHLNDNQKALEQFKAVLNLTPDDSEALEEYKYTQSLINVKDAKEKQSEEMDKVEFNDNYKKQMLEYQSARKKNNSAFRRSHHEINMQLQEEDITQKYHQVLDEKNKLKVILQELQEKQRAQNNTLRQMYQIIADHSSLRKDLKRLVQNGPNYVEVNAKKAHKVLSLSQNIIAHLETNIYHD